MLKIVFQIPHSILLFFVLHIISVSFFYPNIGFQALYLFLFYPEHWIPSNICHSFIQNTGFQVRYFILVYPEHWVPKHIFHSVLSRTLGSKSHFILSFIQNTAFQTTYFMLRFNLNPGFKPFFFLMFYPKHWVPNTTF